jgi:2-polyprenyl-3-methyl-5-hydroxy-6-metoxy-1,4-benzoquinol methylase
MSHLKQHWEQVYTSKGDTETSWYESVPQISLSLIKPLLNGLSGARLIDVGGGTSNLVPLLLAEHLIQSGAVLDISEAAIRRSREKAGHLADSIEWLVDDVTEFECHQPFDIWHDRAVLHFLTEPQHQRRYVQRLDKALKVDGYAVIATFAVGGPEKCSNLSVQQYDEQRMTLLLGDKFQLLKSLSHQHLTPWNSSQLFQYFVVQKKR